MKTDSGVDKLILDESLLVILFRSISIQNCSNDKTKSSNLKFSDENYSYVKSMTKAL